MRNEDLLNALQAENRRLRELLIRPGISLESAVPARLFNEEEKIRIFRSLFRVREDIRWERADGGPKAQLNVTIATAHKGRMGDLECDSKRHPGSWGKTRHCRYRGLTLNAALSGSLSPQSRY